MFLGGKALAQLIKLKDYISRYQQNILLYPSRFVRLKKQKWEGVKSAFDSKDMQIFYENPDLTEYMPEEKESIFLKIRGMMNRKTKDEESLLLFPDIVKEEEEDKEEQLFSFNYKANEYNEPQSLEQLKLQFLNQLFQFQMKWASSTLTEKSTVKKAFYYDDLLKYFLQRFPDTYLVLYKPVFLLKNAPIEVETILVTPTAVWCITVLEAEDSAVFVGSNEKFWVKKYNSKEKKILSPVIALNRTEKIIRGIFDRHDVTLPIQKAILTRNGYIDYPTIPYDLKIIEKRNYDEWFQMMRNNQSPIKATQLKGAESLLQYCLTTSVRRYDWDSTGEEES